MALSRTVSYLALAPSTLALLTWALNPTPVLVEDPGCTDCISLSLQSLDQWSSPLTGANISLAVNPVEDGTCDPLEECEHLDPCKFAYSQVINVGTEGGTIGYQYRTYDATGVRTVNGSRQDLPPGGSDVTNSVVTIVCATSFDYTVSVLTALTSVFGSATVDGGCSSCALVTE